MSLSILRPLNKHQSTYNYVHVDVDQRFTKKQINKKIEIYNIRMAINISNGSLRKSSSCCLSFIVLCGRNILQIETYLVRQKEIAEI